MIENQWDKRYNEPKKIGEIINDMKSHTPGKNRLMEISNKKFMQYIMNLVFAFATRIDLMEPYLKETSLIIRDIEELFQNEKKIYAKYKSLAQDHNLRVSKIYDHINEIDDKLLELEHAQSYVRKQLKSVADTFPDSTDRTEYNDKINAFNHLFMEIYLDIEEIKFHFDRLRKFL